MSHYSWKFTTVKEWKPELFAESDNSDTPVCLIENELKEAQAFLIPYVKQDCSTQFVFSNKDEDRVFASIEDATNYIGLNESVPEEKAFLKQLKLFVLTEQAKYESQDVLCDGIHTPYNDALQKMLLEDKDDSYFISAANVLRPNYSVINDAVKEFRQSKDGIVYNIFNNMKLNNTKAITNEALRGFVERNMQAKFVFRKIAALVLDENEEYKGFLTKDKFEPLYFKYIKPKEKESKETILHMNIVDPEGLPIPSLLGMTVVYFKQPSYKLGVVCEDKMLNKTKVVFGTFVYDVQTKTFNNSSRMIDADNFIEETLKEVLSVDINYNDYQEEFQNGLAVNIENFKGFKRMLVYKGASEKAINNTNNAEIIETNLSNDIPPSYMQLSDSEIFLLLNKMKDLSETDIVSRDIQQYDSYVNEDDLRLENGEQKPWTFSNNYHVIVRNDNGKYITQTTFGDNEGGVVEEHKNLEALKQYMNKVSRFKNSTINTVEKNTNDSDFTTDDLSALDKADTRFVISGKSPHNIALTIKHLPESKLSLKLSELGADHYYDHSLGNLNSRYQNLQDFLDEKDIDPENLTMKDKETVVEILNFIKNNKINTSDKNIIPLVRDNKDKNIKFYYHNDKDISLSEIESLTPDELEAGVYFCFAQRTDTKAVEGLTRDILVVKVTKEADKPYMVQWMTPNHKDDYANRSFRIFTNSKGVAVEPRPIGTHEELTAELNKLKNRIKKVSNSNN